MISIPYLQHLLPALIWPSTSVGRATEIYSGCRGFKSHSDESFPLSLAGLSSTTSADTQLDVSIKYHCTVLNPLINYSDVMFARQQVKYTLEKKYINIFFDNYYSSNLRMGNIRGHDSEGNNSVLGKSNYQ